MKIDDIAIIGYASHFNHPNVQVLQSTLEHWGWGKLQLWGGSGYYLGHHIKLDYLKSALPMLKARGFSHFIALDTFDTICFKEPNMQLLDIGDKLMLSCELACWPDSSLESSYPKKIGRYGETLWRHVNSGGIFGSIDLTIELMKEYPSQSYHDDQLYWTHVYLKESKKEEANGAECRVFTDSDCQLFQTTGHCNPWSKFFTKNEDGTITNEKTLTRPAFWHANGGSEIAWMMEHIK